MKNFRNLSVWGKNHQLTLNTYKVTSSFSREGLYGLVSQMRRAAVSVSSNSAFGSAPELEYQIILYRDLVFIDKKSF